MPILQVTVQSDPISKRPKLDSNLAKNFRETLLVRDLIDRRQTTCYHGSVGLSFSFLLRPAFLALLTLTFTNTLSIQAQEWRYYGGDAGGTKYSALKQINRENVSQLKPTWTFDTGDFSDGTQYPPKSAFEGTP